MLFRPGYKWWLWIQASGVRTVVVHWRPERIFCNTMPNVIQERLRSKPIRRLTAHWNPLSARTQRTHMPICGYTCESIRVRFFRVFELFLCLVCLVEMVLYDDKFRKLPFSGEKPFACSACPKRYVQKSDMYRHVRSQHKEILLKAKNGGLNLASKGKSQSRKRKA